MHDNIEVAQTHQMRNYNKNRKDVQYQIGQQVRIFIPAVKRGQSRKFTHQWIGPYTIIEQLSPVTYRVKSNNDRIISSAVHVQRMKPYIDPQYRLQEDKNEFQQIHEEDIDWDSSEFPTDIIHDTCEFEVPIEAEAKEKESTEVVKSAIGTTEQQTTQQTSTVADSIESFSNQDNDITDPFYIEGKGIPEAILASQRMKTTTGKMKQHYLVRWKGK